MGSEHDQPDLKDRERKRAAWTIEQVLFHAEPEHFKREKSSTELRERDLDKIIDMAKKPTCERSTGEKNQMLQRLCEGCSRNSSKGFCALRTLDDCVLLRHALPVIDAVHYELKELPTGNKEQEK